tara:strand:+ start:200625 stop:202073 length:1449 start_codon:yes stop_codon:yes gene_type:complete
MNFGAEELFPQVPSLRPAMNVGCLFDIPIGTYYTGKHGESILNGGLQQVTGTCGRGNSYKSTLSDHLNLTVVNRYEQVNEMAYDSEYSKTPARLNSLASRMHNIGGLDLFAENRCILSDGTTMANDYWEMVRNFADKKAKMGDKAKLATPFFVDGKQISIIAPSLLLLDSMSQMQFDATETINDKAVVDSKDQNTIALRDNLIKSRMLGQMPSVASKGSIYCTVVAHMGDDLALDPMAPPQKKLATMKQKIKFKKVPENFTFLTNNLYYCSGAKAHHNQADKTPYFPKSEHDRNPGDQDLQIIQVQNLRAKSGPSGIPFQIVVSQTEGLLPTLTELTYLRNNKKVSNTNYPMGFGVGGNDRGYFLDIYPDVKLSRTTVRGIADEDYLLQRAMEITAEMCQMQLIWKGDKLADKYRITPEELYTRLKEKGYDWSVLLNTRGYWVFEGSTDPLNFLSTMDLLKMALPADDVDVYHPYWMEPLKK